MLNFVHEVSNNFICQYVIFEVLVMQTRINEMSAQALNDSFDQSSSQFASGLIAFKFQKIFSAIKAFPVLRTLASTVGDAKFRHIIFEIIESGMALLVIQVGGVVLTLLPHTVTVNHIINFFIVTQRMFNVIIRSVLNISSLFVLLITFFYLHSHQQ